MTDKGEYLLHLLLKLVYLQVGKPLELHIHNCLSLDIVEAESLAEGCLCICDIGAGSDDSHNFVDVVHSHDKGFQYVSPLLCLLELELGAAGYHYISVLYEILYKFF